jgi:hypothetical protein
MGLGFGMIFAPASNTATAGVQRQDSGVASALVNTMQQVGGSVVTTGHPPAGRSGRRWRTQRPDLRASTADRLGRTSDQR